MKKMSLRLLVYLIGYVILVFGFKCEPWTVLGGYCLGLIVSLI
jgi:hypothetical protein